MREIKFRVWNIDEYISLNKAVHDDIVVIQQPSSSNDSLIEINWEGVELEQFTGMHDKYGVPIYEGDVLLDENNHHWLVSFLDGRFIAHVPGTIYNFVDLDDYQFSVVGNIHQHAHLLEQNKC